MQSRGSSQKDWFAIRLYCVSGTLRLEDLLFSTRAHMEQAPVMLRLQEARERAIFHQSEDLPLSRDETQRTRLLETLADDVTRVEIKVHLQKREKRKVSMTKPGLDFAF